MDQKIPGKTPPRKAQTREERLKAALKANMAKRKAQARARMDQPLSTDDDDRSGRDSEET